MQTWFTCNWAESVFIYSNQHVRLLHDFISQKSCIGMSGNDTRHECFTCKCDDEKQIKDWRGLFSDLRRRFMQHFAENGCNLLFQLVEICRGSKPMKFDSTYLKEMRPYLRLHPHSQNGFCRRAWARSCSTCTVSPGRLAAGGWRPDLRPAPPCTSTLLMWPKCDREGESGEKVRG